MFHLVRPLLRFSLAFSLALALPLPVHAQDAGRPRINSSPPRVRQATQRTGRKRKPPGGVTWKHRLKMTRLGVGTAPADKLLAEAKAAEAAKDPAKALTLRQEHISLLETLYGQEHPITIGTINALADLYREAKQPVDALPLYQRVLAYREKQAGEEAQLAVTLNDVAKTLYSLARYAEAEPLYRRCLLPTLNTI